MVLSEGLLPLKAYITLLTNRFLVIV